MAKPSTSVRVYDDVLADARIAASYRGIPLVDWMSEAMRQQADRDIAEGHARRERERGQGAGETPPSAPEPKRGRRAKGE